MICKSCSAETPDRSVFCQNCGKRLAGKAVCPSCNTLSDDNANFCMTCGAKLKADVVCPQCGSIYSGSFCPACGSQATEKAVTTDSFPNPDTKNAASAKVGETVAGSLGMVIVFFAFLFMFLIGLSVNVSGNTGESIGSDVDINGTLTISQYFGKSYSEIANILSTFEEYDAVYGKMLYASSMFGTVIAVTTIISVTVFGIIAVTKFILYITDVSQKDYSRFVLASVLSYLGGTVAFLALHALGGYAHDKKTSISTNVALSGVTIVGVVLSCILTAAFIICKIVFGRQSRKEKICPSTFISIGCLVLLGLALAFASMPTISFTNDGNTVKMGYTGLLEMILTSCTKPEIPSELTMTVFLTIVGQIVQLITIVFIMLSMRQVSGSLCKNNSKIKFVFPILAFVFALFNFIIAVLTVSQFESVMVLDARDSFFYELMLLLFSGLGLTAYIVSSIFAGNNKKRIPKKA